MNKQILEVRIQTDHFQVAQSPALPNQRKVSMKEGRPRRVPTARGADYNAFGYDPEGALAHLASHLYGPSWKPSYTVHQFVGAAEAPRYGPPAPYQEAYLPADFRPRTPPLYYGHPCPPFIPPPIRFNPHHFDALLCSERLSTAMGK
jgi:hypothetical protein